MARQSRAMESFSRFIVATIVGVAIVGGMIFAFIAFDNHGCSGGIECRTADQRAQVHY